MKILITGSAGFVGKHMVKKLSQKHQIVEYDLVNGQDVLNGKLLGQKLRGVDLVIHLAAFISATESWEKPMDYMKNNTLGTLSVVESAIEAGVKKMIFFSSAAVKAKPLTPYAVSKINAENILGLYKDRINIVVVRPENIYGPGQREAYGYVIHNFINAIKNGKEISIYGDGKQTRDFIYVDDIVATVEKIAEMKIRSGTVISLGTGKEIKIIDLAKLVMKVMSKKTRIEFSKKRREPRRSIADTRMLSKLKIDARKFGNLNKGIKNLL